MTRYRFDPDSLNRTFGPLVMALVIGSGVFSGGLLVALLLTLLSGSADSAG